MIKIELYGVVISKKRKLSTNLLYYQDQSQFIPARSISPTDVRPSAIIITDSPTSTRRFSVPKSVVSNLSCDLFIASLIPTKIQQSFSFRVSLKIGSKKPVACSKKNWNFPTAYSSLEIASPSNIIDPRSDRDTRSIFR